MTSNTLNQHSNDLDDRSFEIYTEMFNKEKDDFVSAYVLPISCSHMITMWCVFFSIDQTNKSKSNKRIPKFKIKNHDKNYKRYFDQSFDVLKRQDMIHEGYRLDDPSFMFECCIKLMHTNYEDDLTEDSMGVLVLNSILNFSSSTFLKDFQDFEGFLNSRNSFCFLIFVCQFFAIWIKQCESMFDSLVREENFERIKNVELWSHWKSGYREIISDLKRDISLIPSKTMNQGRIDGKYLFNYINVFSKQAFSAVYFIFVIKSVIERL